jgi:thioredoxin-dependent peroxiredoxin
MYGKEYEGVIRSTVLVDPDGTVAAVWPKVQPKKHADPCPARGADRTLR